MSGHLPQRVPVVKEANSGVYPLIRYLEGESIAARRLCLTLRRSASRIFSSWILARHWRTHWSLCGSLRQDCAPHH